jgi:hypothetical protein
MKSRLLTAALGMVLVVVFSTCKNDNTTGPGVAGTGIISGEVHDAITSAALAGVTVTGDSPVGTDVKTTGVDGKYSLSYTLDSTSTVQVTLQKTGYRDSVFFVNIRSGITVGPLQNRLWSALPQGPAVLSGVIKDLTTGTLLSGIIVSAQSLVLDPQSATSDAQGKFLITFPVDSNYKGTSALVGLVIKTTGYRDTTVSTVVQFGTVTQTTIRLIPKNAAIVQGTIFERGSSTPVSAVTVQGTVMSGGTGTSISTSNLLGEYSLTFAVDTSAIVRLAFSKVGYRDTVFYTRVNPAAASNIDLSLSSGFTGGGGGSGIAQTIAFTGASLNEISVYGVGGKETSVLSWEVRDSLGQPIDVAHAVPLTFQILNGPGGGEYLSPVTVTTTSAGRADVTLNAGTRAGVAQVVAQTVVGGRTISSQPAKVTINGGFPVQERFTIAAELYNFPALNWLNKRDKIQIMAGDKYSNPVEKGWAVYFRSSAGVIQSTVLTDLDGQGTVDLISGNPRPFPPFTASETLPDSCYHWVVARTNGQGGVTVTDSVLILWSGQATLFNLPGPFVIGNDSSRSFNFGVSDEHRHPLAAGTQISVTAAVPPPPSPDVAVNQVNLSFGRNGVITLGDSRYYGYMEPTLYSFTLSDGTSSIIQNTSVTITISVTGPNGSAVYSFSGIVR